MILPTTCQVTPTGDGWCIRINVVNNGVFDIDEGLMLLFDGHPNIAAAPSASLTHKATLKTKQLGHCRFSIPGREQVAVTIMLQDRPTVVYAQVFACDIGAESGAHVCQLPLP